VTALTVHLVRHAAHGSVVRMLVGRRPGVSLSDEGWEQARALARRLTREAVTRIETSPLNRARETASAIADALSLPVHVEAALDEVDFGAWTGSAFHDLTDDPAWRRWNEARGLARAPGGEDMAGVLGRMLGRIERLRAERPGECVVLVGHCEPIRATLLHMLGLTPEAWSRLDVAPASLSTVVVDDRGARILRINEVAGT
jgi:broad specificity phosphatase PhoE